jgi:RES domain-containing protein
VSTSKSLDQRLRSFERRRSKLRLFRGVRESYEPLSTRGARIRGGRWNPAGLVALYAAFQATTVRAELARGAERRGLPEESIYPVVLVEIEVGAQVIDLSDPARLEALGIASPFSVLAPIEVTQKIGRAAARQSVGALIVPSVVTRGDNAVIFPDNLGGDVEVVRKRRVSSPSRWP